MKEILLTRGLKTMVDDDDYSFLSKFKWHARTGNKKAYAWRATYSQNKQTLISMARLLLKCPEGLVVDHINGDTLDNRRANLRIATYSQNNSAASRRKTAKMNYRGIYKRGNKWLAMITIHKKPTYIGCFNTEKEAALAYNNKAKETFGEFANLNKL